ncbi:outer membrane lipoprotein chaperone LolA [Ideonella oryzae]|uniref:Outer-membrane lipoprotein carrier protein n=1 Tax=Ideonella oryzae TaxID=2937441 RepID=A0ABT1BJ03_9BURK|nr:outer membrane lipoprotein chaperone LolA [Ideonella oryzae]MCO5976093.1 outer membrane lipoprotein chaperone LolA [Ideonella oryzae]
MGVGFGLGLGWSQLALAAGAADALRAFVQDAKAGRASFTQTVHAPNSARTKVSTGRFEFSRPNRFRFEYQKPYAQTIVSDGEKVWFHDPDLNQVTVRKLGDALGSTPAAILAGQSIERDFDLKDQPDQDGLSWVLATPKGKEGTIQSLRVGFKGRSLSVIEIADSFGQRSVLQFADLQILPSLPASTFHFAVPAGADVSAP